MSAPVPAELTGKIANSASRYLRVPLYRTGETWLVRYSRLLRDRGTYLVSASDSAIHGPFGSLDAAERYVGRNGGGYLDWGTSSNLIPDRGAEEQMALLHKANGCPWWTWQDCENAPRAFLGCGHVSH